LIEAYLAWSDRNGALREFKVLQQRWDKDKAEFTGADWITTAADWQERYSKIERKLATSPSPNRAPKDSK
jgi:hypothetical protein